MAGPYPPHQGTDLTSAHQPPTGPSDAGFREAMPFGAGSAGAYPGPPVPYPPRRRGRTALLWVAVLAVVAAAVAAVVFSARDGGQPAPSATITQDSAKRAIQGYLDALNDKDLQTISRNALCGLYDGVRDRRADDALAKMSADAFNKQFSGVEVLSIDQIVFASHNSAQVLFTMRATPARGNRGPDERQGVAQLLTHNDELLVCSYVLRTAGAF